MSITSITKTYSALMIAFTLVGCTSVPETQNLTKITNNTDVIFLPQRVTYKTPQKTFAGSWNHSLLPGKYKADLQNSYGTYYVGQGKLIHLQPVNVPEIPSVTRVGGIWVPSDPQKKPKIYSIKGTDSTAQYIPTYTGGGAANIIGTALGGAIVDAIIASENGEIYLFDEIQDTEFISTLRKLIDQKGPETASMVIEDTSEKSTSAEKSKN